MRSQRIIIKRGTHRKKSRKKSSEKTRRRNRRNRKIRRTRRRSIKQNGGMFGFGFFRGWWEDTFLEKIKNTLKTLTSSEWSEESLPIGQQWCKGNNEYFYQCYLDKLIESLRELNLKKDKFFGLMEQYIHI